MSTTLPPFEQGRLKKEDCIIILHNSKGDFIDIEPIVAEMAISNSLYISGSSIQLLLNDSTNLVKNFPIVGDELIEVELRTPTTEGGKKIFKSIKYLFKITSMESRNRTFRSESFVLNGITFENINNLTKSVNKSYVNLRIDQMVKAVYESFIKVPSVINSLNVDPFATKLVTLQKTLGEKTFVFPGIDPIKVIKFLCREAEIDPSKDTSLGNNFLFYHNSLGWHFTTKDLLLKNEPIEKFVLKDASGDVSSEKGQKFDYFQIMNEFNFEEQFDSIQNIDNGLFNFLIETIDPITKQFSEDFFVYNKQKRFFRHLDVDGDAPYSPNNKFGLIHNERSDYSKEYDSGRSIYNVSNIGNNYSNLDYLKHAKDSDYQIENPRTIHKNLKYKQAMNSSFNLKYSSVIPGNTELEIGNVIECELPAPSQEQDDLLKNDLMTGSKFLITELRHYFTRNEAADTPFFTRLELEKNSYGAHNNYLEPKE